MALHSSKAKRIMAGVVLVIAFLCMASVFAPDGTQAQQREGETSAWRGDDQSDDPHTGLRSLGEIQSNAYIVRIYATQLGPRYSVYEASTGRELGALLTVNQVQQAWPEIRITDIDFSGAGLDGAIGPLMLAEPQARHWSR